MRERAIKGVRSFPKAGEGTESGGYLVIPLENSADCSFSQAKMHIAGSHAALSIVHSVKERGGERKEG